MERGASLKIAAALLGAMLAPSLAAAEPDLRQDGWYRWEVPAGAAGRSACCYEFRGGAVTGAVGCRLGHGEDDLLPMGDCNQVRASNMHIYVEVKGGRTRDIRALSSNCPVQTGPGLRTIENVSTGDSISWLLREIENESRAAEEALMALSFHAEREALPALITLLEDRRQRMKVREEALFWLVQTESDAAFAYLDRLLD